jgi:septum formation protein
MRFRHKVFLASQSPRRREYISYLFENIEIINPEFNEPLPNSKEVPLRYLRRCLQAKWDGVLKQMGPRCEDKLLILVADTIVVYRQKVFGKPSNKTDATNMIRLLAGKEHSVYTGICLARSDERTPSFEIVETKVTFKNLSPSDIAKYVARGESIDKAGAYGFQNHGVQLVESVKGSYFNVIGLPLESLRQKASQMGLS